MSSSICATVVLLLVTTLPPPSLSFHLPGALQGGGSYQKNLRRYSNAVKNLHSSSPQQKVVTEDPPYSSEYILRQRSSSSSKDSDTETNIIIQQLKNELLALAESTRRGFSASKLEKEQVKRIMTKLSLYSPTNEPAAAYYESSSNNDMARTRSTSSIAGKWTLLYSDAPDITSLDNTPPFVLPAAKLGRIGQECNPPSIKNVIEWQRPNWVSFLPFNSVVGGVESSRIIQKVCLEGSATRDQPSVVNLKVVGLELMGMTSSSSGGSGGGGPAAYLESNPIRLQGGSALPFGKFDILYLDDTMRITKTFQGYYAVNVREEVPWF